jgi:endoglucanase
LQMTPYSDPNVIYAFHDYNPSTFANQGAYWITSPVGISELSNVPYPSYLAGLQTLMNQTSDPNVLSLLQEYQAEYWDSERINWDIQTLAAWEKIFNARLVVNEFGVYKLYAPPASRAQWLYDMTTAFAAHGLGWAMWDYNGGYDLTIGSPGAPTIDPALLPALGFQPWTTPVPIPPGPPRPPPCFENPSSGVDVRTYEAVTLFAIHNHGLWEGATQYISECD